MLVLLITWCAPIAHGQSDVLKGPIVQEDISIVEHTMSGMFQRVEGRPEMAAFNAVTNDPALTQRAIEIELERTVAISMLLIDQIDLMKESTDAMLAGDNTKAREIQGQLHTLFDPRMRHDPLTPKLLELLDDRQQSKYKKALNEYWEAWIDASLRDRMNRDELAVRNRVRARLTTNLFQTEMREAYDISLKQYRDSMETIYLAVDPTEDQREAMREILIQYIKDTRLDPTPLERREATMQMYSVLDQERQAKFFEYLLKIVVPDSN